MDTIKLLSEYQTIFVWVIGAAIFVFLTLLATKFATKGDHDKLQGNHDALSKLVDKLEVEFIIVKNSHIRLKEEFMAVSKAITILQTKVDALPTIETIAELRQGMTRLEGSIGVCLEKFESSDDLIIRLEKQVEKMDRFLLERSIS